MCIFIHWKKSIRLKDIFRFNWLNSVIEINQPNDNQWAACNHYTRLWHVRSGEKRDKLKVVAKRISQYFWQFEWNMLACVSLHHALLFNEWYSHVALNSWISNWLIQTAHLHFKWAINLSIGNYSLPSIEKRLIVGVKCTEQSTFKMILATST